MTESPGTRLLLRLATVAVLGFIYMPLGRHRHLRVQREHQPGVAASRVQPPAGSSRRSSRRGVRDALWASIRAAIGATAIALVLGSLAAFAVHRFRFFGRDGISLLVHPAHRAAGHRHGHGAQRRVPDRSACAFGTGRPSSSATPRSAWSSSTTTCWPGSGACPARSRRRPWTWVRASSRRSGMSRSRPSGRPSWRVACSRSRCPSTRSS